MNTKINTTVNILRLEYSLIWILTLVIIVLYETEILQQGSLAGNAQAEYISQLTGVLLTIILIPMSLRLFNISLTRYIKQLTFQKALSSYRRWSEIRIFLLLVVAIVNISLYYSLFDISNLLCGAMSLLASLFCIPGRQRLITELDLSTETFNQKS